MLSCLGCPYCSHAAPESATDRINVLDITGDSSAPLGLLSHWIGHDSELACKQSGKMSIRPRRPSQSTWLSALGKVCEWVVALSASSLCSGVSRRQEVIEFTLLKVSISAQPGNPSEMKWTADVCVCVSGGSTKGENSVSGGEREGGNYKDKNRSRSKMFRGRKKPNHQIWKMWHTHKKKKTQIRFTQVPNLLNSYLKRSANLISLTEFWGEILLWKHCLARSQRNTAKTDQSEQWCLRKKFADSAICNL